MDLDEASRQLHRRRFVGDLEQEEAADHFLGFRERSVRYADLTRAEPHARAVRGRLEARGRDHRARLGPFVDELTHGGVELGRHRLAGLVVLVVGDLDQHEKLHGWAPFFRGFMVTTTKPLGDRQAGRAFFRMAGSRRPARRARRPGRRLAARVVGVASYTWRVVTWATSSIS